MYTNKPEFRVKDVIKLAQLSSTVLNDLLSESGVYLSNRILSYILAQQINIQIATDKELNVLRSFINELEDYTILQLLNFVEIQGIELDTFDIKFRLWTVVFNNIHDLQITDSAIQAKLKISDELFEYPKDIVYNLTRFVDEGNDLDGKPFIVAKESLNRFSTIEEVEAFGNSLGIEIPKRMDRESVVKYILRGLEDSNPALKEELMSKTMEEIEQYARENFISNDILLSKKEMVNFILNKHTPKDHHINDVEYEKHLEIPSLHGVQPEPEDDTKAGPLFDDSLKEMIATIVRGENHKMVEDITEEKSREELEEVMNRILNTYEAPKRESEEILLKKIDSLEQKMAERNSYDPNMYALMNKISNMETELLPKKSPNRDDLILKKIEELDLKITRVARGEDPALSEAQNIEKTLLSKIADLEEKLSYQRTNYREEYSIPLRRPEVQLVEQQVAQVTVKEVVEEPVEEIIEETVVVKTVPVALPVETDSDDYEYDLQGFVPRKPSPLAQLIETEAIEETVQEIEIEEIVEEPVKTGPSETELMLLQKLEEIERKLEEKDSQIETLIRDSQKKVEVVVEPVQIQVEEPALEEESLELKENQVIEETVDKEELTIVPEETISTIVEEVKAETTEDSEESDEESDSDDESKEETIEDILNDIEEMSSDEEMAGVEEALENPEDKSEFDKFIEEIHSNKDNEKIKVRRRHTVKPILVFWRAMAIWVMLLSIGAIILFVYNSL